MSAPHPANRLAGETSPYLLQHARNPVDWYPWGEEAFAEARRRDVPIFLSIGYATCYWCHVMERESFESADIARILNEKFVCVKVDREQRPDVDDVYMTAVQLLTGRGGWPMSVFLTPPGARGAQDPGLEPYWGGTYFPPEGRPGMPGFPQVLGAMSNAYENQRADALAQSASLTEAIRAHLSVDRVPIRLSHEPVRRAFEALWSSFDATNGGFHGAPKFPQAVFLEFLLDAHAAFPTGEERDRAARMLRLTLDRMAMGGVFDQVGGGFHRYAVDATWTVPHFEKMLYDQGQLAGVYARAAEVFEDPFYARIARRVCAYAVREMQQEPGGFSSAQDAEVDAREGLNYLWTRDEFSRELSEPDAEFAERLYGVDAGPNFQDPHHPGEPPRNVLKLVSSPERLAENEGVTVAGLWDRLDAVNAALYDVRARRQQPALDDKVLASWNGLMIAGLAETARALDEPALAKAAARAAGFVLREMRDEHGALRRVWRAGKSETPALLEDYAFMVRGLLALHTATGDARWRDEAGALVAVAEERFGSPSGGWFDAPDGRSDLIVRLVSTSDGAVPCASSVMLGGLLAMRHDAATESLFGRGIAALSAAVAANPLAAINTTRLLLDLDAEFLDRFGMGVGADELRPAPNDSPVEVFSSASELAVGPGGAELHLELRIAEGFHINAHEPGVDGLTGLEVDLDGGMGFEVVVDYPAGRAMEGSVIPEGETLFAHTGAVRIPVHVRHSGEPVTGTPRLVVTYQACTDRACMEPMQAVLGVAFTLPTAGESG